MLKEVESNYQTEESHEISDLQVENIRPIYKNISEDMFTAKYITPLLKPYFIKTEYLEVTGCGEESKGSKDRKNNNYGLKPDIIFKVTAGKKTQSISLLEIKPKEQCDIVAHPDLTKRANIMKNKVDQMLFENCPVVIPIYGMEN